MLFEVIVTVLVTTDLVWMCPAVDAVFVIMDGWIIPLVLMVTVVVSLLLKVVHKIAISMVYGADMDMYLKLTNATGVSV